MTLDNTLIEDVLVEMDGIFQSRTRTMDILLGRFVEFVFTDQLCRTLRVQCQTTEGLLRLWVNYRRALRNVPGYEIVMGKDMESFVMSEDAEGNIDPGEWDAKEQEALKKYDAQPKKIKKILTPDEKKA